MKTFWKIIHNLIAHPLLVVGDIIIMCACMVDFLAAIILWLGELADDFHDWTAGKMSVLIIGCLLLASCEYDKYEKPFIVVDKERSVAGDIKGKTVWVYTYEDRHGKETSFCSTMNYQPGDTLP